MEFVLFSFYRNNLDHSPINFSSWQLLWVMRELDTIMPSLRSAVAVSWFSSSTKTTCCFLSEWETPVQPGRKWLPEKGPALSLLRLDRTTCFQSSFPLPPPQLFHLLNLTKQRDRSELPPMWYLHGPYQTIVCLLGCCTHVTVMTCFHLHCWWGKGRREIPLGY